MAEETSNPAPITSEPTTVTLASTAVAAQTFEGWAALQFSVNVLLPRYIDNSLDALNDVGRILGG
jgi:hypothetical protein